MNLIECMTLSQIHHLRIQNSTLHISNDEFQPVSTVQNQSTNTNCNIDKYDNEVDGDECDLSDLDIKNQMNSSTLEIVNNNDEINYGYK